MFLFSLLILHSSLVSWEPVCLGCECGTWPQNTLTAPCPLQKQGTWGSGRGRGLSQVTSPNPCACCSGTVPLAVRALPYLARVQALELPFPWCDGPHNFLPTYEGHRGVAEAGSAVHWCPSAHSLPFQLFLKLWTFEAQIVKLSQPPSVHKSQIPRLTFLFLAVISC